jgi:hypothetical protein
MRKLTELHWATGSAMAIAPMGTRWNSSCSRGGWRSICHDHHEDLAVHDTMHFGCHNDVYRAQRPGCCDSRHAGADGYSTDQSYKLQCKQPLQRLAPPTALCMS